MVAKPSGFDNFAEFHERLGGVPLNRIGFDPPPGTATEADVIRHMDGEPKRLYELIDGTLVEKAVGTWESILGTAIATRLNVHVEANDLGLVSGADGPFRMLHGNVRYPDVSFIPWEALPDEEIPDEAIWSIIPALAVEVLSESNTAKEIDRKIVELFGLGVQSIWIIDPPSQTAKIYTSARTWANVEAGGKLSADEVLPGFSIAMTELFDKRRRKKSP